MQQLSLRNFLFDVLIIVFFLQYSRTVKDSIAIVGITEALIIGKFFSMIRIQIIHSCFSESTMAERFVKS